MRVTNIAHARQEIGRFCTEVTHPPAGTKGGEETSACREEYPRMRNVNVILQINCILYVYFTFPACRTTILNSTATRVSAFFFGLFA